MTIKRCEYVVISTSHAQKGRNVAPTSHIYRLVGSISCLEGCRTPSQASVRVEFYPRETRIYTCSRTHTWYLVHGKAVGSLGFPSRCSSPRVCTCRCAASVRNQKAREVTRVSRSGSARPRREAPEHTHNAPTTVAHPSAGPGWRSNPRAG